MIQNLIMLYFFHNLRSHLFQNVVTFYEVYCQIIIGNLTGEESETSVINSRTFGASRCLHMSTYLHEFSFIVQQLEQLKSNLKNQSYRLQNIATSKALLPLSTVKLLVLRFASRCLQISTYLYDSCRDHSSKSQLYGVARKIKFEILEPELRAQKHRKIESATAVINRQTFGIASRIPPSTSINRFIRFLQRSQF